MKMGNIGGGAVFPRPDSERLREELGDQPLRAVPNVGLPFPAPHKAGLPVGGRRGTAQPPTCRGHNKVLCPGCAVLFPWTGLASYP